VLLNLCSILRTHCGPSIAGPVLMSRVSTSMPSVEPVRQERECHSLAASMQLEGINCLTDLLYQRSTSGTFMDRTYQLQNLSSALAQMLVSALTTALSLTGLCCVKTQCCCNDKRLAFGAPCSPKQV